MKKNSESPQYISARNPKPYVTSPYLCNTVLGRAQIEELKDSHRFLKRRIDTFKRLESAKLDLRQKRWELKCIKNFIYSVSNKISNIMTMQRNAVVDINHYNTTKQINSMETYIVFGEHLLSALEKNTTSNNERLFGCYQGFAVILPSYMKEERPYIILQGCNRYIVKINRCTALGCMKKIDYFLEHLENSIVDYEKGIEKLNMQKEDAIISYNEFYLKENELDDRVATLERYLSLIDKKIQSIPFKVLNTLARNVRPYTI